MKNKFISIILISLLLCGCSSTATKDNVRNNIENILDTYLNIDYRTNHTKKLFSYYVPTNVGVIKQTSTSTVFKYDNAKFLLTLNVSNILNDESLSITSDIQSDNIVYHTSGSFNQNDTQIEYELSIIPVNNRYYIDFESETVSLYGYSYLAQINGMLKAMCKIMKSVSLDYEKVKSIYDKEDIIESTKKQLDIFTQVVPESGRLEELIDNNGAVPTLLPESTSDIAQETEAPQESSDSETTSQPETPSESEDIYYEG